MTRALSPILFQRKASLQLMALCLILPLCVMIALPFLDRLDWGQVGNAWQKIDLLQWVGALLATCASFAALGRYDVIIHRVLSTNVNSKAAQAGGAAAVALSQTLGFGLIIGTLARWRGLQSLSVITASAVTALVSLSFLGAWLMIFALAGLLSPGSLPLPIFVFKACLFSAICFVVYTALKRHITLAGFRARLPSLRALASLIAFTAIDTSCAALAFWLLLPTDLEIGFLFFFPIYLASLGVALVSNSPGGLGPFEITLFWALPHVDINALLASLIAFRLIYFALPACIAMLYLIRPLSDAPSAPTNRFFSQGLHPETPSGLQTGSPLTTASGQMIGALARTTQTSTLLFDPASDLDQSCAALRQKAENSATGILFYKCSKRFAAKLRKRGFAVSRIAQDGVLDLKKLTLDCPSRRNLRRKLRYAHKAGIDVKQLDLTQGVKVTLSDIDTNWNQTNGNALGVSMGRFHTGYLASQAVFGAYQDEQLVAFISCHKSPDTWTLDLMRAGSKLPSGTMYALVWKAIETAQESGCATFSLASTSYTDITMIRLIQRLNLHQRTSTDGLAQFKRCFAPRWTPLYAAAPTKTGLCLALWDVWQEVHDPPPLKSS